MVRPGLTALFLSWVGVIMLVVPPVASIRDEDEARSAVEISDSDMESAEGPRRNREIAGAYGLPPPKSKKKTKKTRRIRRKKKKVSAGGENIFDMGPLLEKYTPVLEPVKRSKAERVEIVDRKKGDAVEVETEEAILTAEELIETDSCCDGSAGRAEDASQDGMYTIIVSHSGLSLSDTGAPGSCRRSETSMPSVDVEYLCPQECFNYPLTEERFHELLSNPDSTEDDVERCDSNECQGTCQNPNDGRWYWDKVVSTGAPRLRECSVKSGGKRGSVVMTSSCSGRFEDWRQLYFAKKGM